ncbi:hypothetical protein PanWU01x14_089070 [Parasponia andersonii]|uniref:Uncharacterized protein n=1 Tax=Parasponia andersonii TaxID=3476 RepID=A0A2P5D889_PARAD|nr:hypothetical protein PanWU01x14_089070 [Parasponia andersonii]
MEVYVLSHVPVTVKCRCRIHDTCKPTFKTVKLDEGHKLLA